ncbi:SDR family NAD(P)-dependent oxidoreductase [Auritidibacter ignavus]|uniref:SDR family NAD(P)-dependent oxidoreductase n=1 Tax=Auritidibacter ignavus TaxID=678932 RepID=UPI00109C847A|nr:SDR family oxidoreductase [Auritidibacter ignavus]
MNFTGEVALVTGGGAGIGEAISKTLATHGLKIVVSDINLENAEKVANEIIEAGGEAKAVEANAAVPEDAKASVQAAVDAFGGLNYAVNNAGISGDPVPVADVELDDWKKVIDVNLNGVFYGMKYQIPELLKNPAASGIVNLASILGSVGFPHAAAYVTAKHGVVGLTKTAAAEYGEQGLRINALGPGYILTALIEKHLDDETQQSLADKHLLGRLGRAQEVADVAAFLLSDEASFIHGSYHLVDGGYTAV